MLAGAALDEADRRTPANDHLDRPPGKTEKRSAYIRCRPTFSIRQGPTFDLSKGTPEEAIESRILEEHFGEVLRASSYRWPVELAAEVRNNAQPDWIDDSWVSRHPLVSFSREQLAWLYLLATLALLAIGRYSGRLAVRQGGGGRNRAAPGAAPMGREGNQAGQDTSQ